MSPESYTYFFFGKVMPERANVNISPLMGEMKNFNGEKIGEMKTSILVSQITAQITQNTQIQKYDELLTIKNALEDAIRVQLDVLGYTNSCGYDIEITQVTDISGAVRVFGVNVDNTDQFPLKRPKNFSEIMPLFSTETGEYLRLSLSDLREAIRSPKDTGFFCYRSIECLRQYFVDANKLNNQKDKDRQKSWEILRSELDVDRQKIDFIKLYAGPVRHGGKKQYSAEEGKKMLDMTWEILDKYIIFACNGYKK
ncbi:MAG: hypothetical protein CVV34_05495 [Methanomicrobiales archaeon HGW-Methanomicrobiales-5]|nr:MAG: hypothetical protein CVV34_05495 [Methanomicrobiales archaeon HGW-Methanomicrobiales-5]